MTPRFFRFPGLPRLLYSEAIYRKKDAGKKIYITFDDGPTDRGTAEIIDVLKENGVTKAVFFCTGSNIRKHPDSAMLIVNNGFSIANHGYEHLDGWKSRRNDYIDNCIKGSELSGSKFYRPPYGHLTISQYMAIKKIMKIVLWDLLFYDFDINLHPEYILGKAEKLIRPGSVIVLHDKNNEKTIVILDNIIKRFRRLGFNFGDITDDV